MLQAPSLSKLSGIRHAFFTRAGGVSEGVYTSLNGGWGSKDNPARVKENRARMATALGVAADCLVTAYQTHSPEVVTAVRPWGLDNRPEADAIVTTITGLTIGVTTADCGPILLAEAQARVVGAAHAGWRGALAGVIEATVEAMEQCGAERARIVAVLGPMIRQPSYEVGAEVVAKFADADRANMRFFKPSAQKSGHALFDLPRYIAARLAAAGIRQVEDIGRCTYAEADDFFSYRRSTHRGEADYGRHVNAIRITEDG